MSSGGKLCFMSWNSNGLKSKKEDVRNEIEKQQCHVVFLQETHSNEVLEELEDWKSIYTTQTSPNTGVAILIRKDIFDESCTVEKDNKGCYIVVKCTLNGQLFTLVSLYNPPANTRLLMKLRNVIEKNADGILLIGGDFNTALNPYIDRNSETKNKQHLSLNPVVEVFMTSFQLVDVWRRFHPSECEFTYKSSKSPGKAVKSRLDYLFVPEESMHYIKTCEISKEECYSDHQPVLFEIWMSKEESKKPEICLYITEEENKILSSVYPVTDKWLRYKSIYQTKRDLTKNPHTPAVMEEEIVNAIKSLAVNQKQVDRPDRIPLSYYVNNLYNLIPDLCAFCNNILQRSENIPESFNEAVKVSETHYRFNVDYLILATVMARRLHDHLDSHSVEYTDDRKKENKALLFTFKEQPIKVSWFVLRKFLAKEMDKDKTNPPIPDTYLIDIFYRVLKNSSRGKYKLLCWGCPLTPVLMTLCLKCIANEMIEMFENKTSKIFISRENVVVRLPLDFAKKILKNLKEKYIFVECKLVDECKPIDANPSEKNHLLNCPIPHIAQVTEG
uniref:exodeoxyribonuclease III n=1 Tax=Cyprinus carpio TaxID=7962 RepID=A0A8C2HSK9_CYPCA